MDIFAFLGRFHPVVVHLPIGFLVIAILLELYDRRSKSDRFDSAVSVVLFWGGMSSLVAIAFGWMLAAEGTYSGDSLKWHRWLGVSVGLIASASWLLKTKRLRLTPNSYHMSLALLGLTLLFAGHFGGNLTHGPGYLTRFAPAFVRNMLRNGDIGSDYLTGLPGSPDSILVYQHLVAPILEHNCVSCHNNEDHRGGLVLTSEEGLRAGGDHGAIMEPGVPFDSELLVRITLPRDDERAMPPKGEALTYNEIRILEWWLQQKSPFAARVTEFDVPPSIKALLKTAYHIDLEPKRYVETAAPPPLPDSVYQTLVDAGFKVKKVANSSNFLELTHSPTPDTLSTERLTVLQSASKQIVWLNLDGVYITDKGLEIISKLPNLTRLRLQKTPVTDAGVRYLAQLRHLESLNLYATSVTDDVIETLKEMLALKRVYLWQTAVSPEAIENLKRARPDLHVDTGFNFVPVEVESEDKGAGET
jgi:uncharacterized membrane protein